MLDANHALQPELKAEIEKLENMFKLEEGGTKKHTTLEIIAALESLSGKYPKLPLRWMWPEKADEPEFNEEDKYDDEKKEQGAAEVDDGTGKATDEPKVETKATQ